MADVPIAMAERPQRRGRALLAGAMLAVLLAAGGFHAARSGLILAPSGAAAPAARIAFVPLPPVVVSLPPGAGASHLRLTAQIEVDPDRVEEVASLTPRLLDVLNGYLRAVDSRDLQSPPALVRLRAQMLRRVQLVAGPGRVRDLLVTEFVMN